uniref:Uncharacterized protein n=1 Tax=Candidatus Kentrum sp. FM TaxID=2126340 RepID=A0A450TS62_9GAMM|nr:MAG: hypothetical protein BECKFM1743C_GA0114222_105901 [Candidatus Kentron sp. FM]VFJ71607.1 MAG: hypothetical protein BECKFM1743A_GA0114220_105971 [Candidatus Kentron sp. FM]
MPKSCGSTALCTHSVDQPGIQQEPNNLPELRSLDYIKHLFGLDAQSGIFFSGNHLIGSNCSDSPARDGIVQLSFFYN